MLVTPIPFEYLSYFESDERKRRTRSRPTGDRIRRLAPKVQD